MGNTHPITQYTWRNSIWFDHKAKQILQQQIHEPIYASICDVWTWMFYFLLKQFRLKYLSIDLSSVIWIPIKHSPTTTTQGLKLLWTPACSYPEAYFNHLRLQMCWIKPLQYVRLEPMNFSLEHSPAEHWYLVSADTLWNCCIFDERPRATLSLHFREQNVRVL